MLETERLGSGGLGKSRTRGIYIDMPGILTWVPLRDGRLIRALTRAGRS